MPSRIRLYWSVDRFLKMLLSVYNNRKPRVTAPRSYTPTLTGTLCTKVLTFSRISNATAQ